MSEPIRPADLPSRTAFVSMFPLQVGEPTPAPKPTNQPAQPQPGRDAGSSAEPRRS